MNKLQQPTVLVLNRNWQAINVTTPQTVFAMLVTNVATGLDIDGNQHMVPIKWENWVKLPIREEDTAVRTIHGPIRIPTVVVLASFNEVPKKAPKLSSKAIRERDGNRCQYTNRLLKPDEGSLDHVIPRHQGGTSTWENLVWSDKKVNQRKRNRTPEQAGLKLLRPPRQPKELPVTMLIRNDRNIADWQHFLHQ